MSGRRQSGGATACPLHPGSRVIRNGTARTTSGRVQKYFCKPADASRHTFSEPVPGDTAIGRPPRGHRYDASIIARALLALSQGATYRQARIAALGGRPPTGPLQGAEGTPGPIDAKLVSRWLDSFAPRLRELAVAHAPSVAVARCVPVGGRPRGRGGQWLLCLVGWRPGEPPRIWPTTLVSRPDEASWEEMFRRCGTRPALLLCESPPQEAAAVSVWGPAARPRPPAPHGRALAWPELAAEGDVTGHAMGPDTWEAQRGAVTADAMVRRLAQRAAGIRTPNRADILVGLMALEVSGLATAESVTTIVRGR